MLWPNVLGLVRSWSTSAAVRPVGSSAWRSSTYAGIRRPPVKRAGVRRVRGGGGGVMAGSRSGRSAGSGSGSVDGVPATVVAAVGAAKVVPGVIPGVVGFAGGAGRVAVQSPGC
ncbi:hypothetical protein SHKM778_18760 [Streptomyces sp. KM77-8]|uniref:Uncharacterized protein n=1 Tax=Streptomyces haneummycinicus TaxID=3074435 RepID=A0AAT9HDR4_9ACTN